MPGAEHDERHGLDDEQKDEEQRDEDDEPVEGSLADMCSGRVVVVARVEVSLHGGGGGGGGRVCASVEQAERLKISGREGRETGVAEQVEVEDERLPPLPHRDSKSREREKTEDEEV